MMKGKAFLAVKDIMLMENHCVVTPLRKHAFLSLSKRDCSSRVSV